MTTPPSLSDAQQALLSALLDALVPASADGRMPSAAEVGFGGYLVTQAPDFAPELVALLQRLEPGFSGLSLDARCEELRHLQGADPLKFSSLLARVYDCYYQHDAVREAIGVVQGAVFPQGNEVTQGDLSLLDSVIEHRERHRYRPA